MDNKTHAKLLIISIISISIIGSASSQLSNDNPFSTLSTQNYEPLLGDIAAGTLVAAFIYFILWFTARILDSLYDNGTTGKNHLDDMLDYSSGFSSKIGLISVLAVVTLVGTGFLGPYLDTIQSTIGVGLYLIPALILAGLAAIAFKYGVGNAGTVGLPGIITGVSFFIIGLIITSLLSIPGGLLISIIAGILGLGIGSQFGAGFLGVWNRPSGQVAGRALRQIDNTLGGRVGPVWERIRDEAVLQHTNNGAGTGPSKNCIIYKNNLNRINSVNSYGITYYECECPQCGNKGFWADVGIPGGAPFTNWDFEEVN